MKTYIASFNYIGEIELTKETVLSCAIQGAADDNVAFELTKDEVKKELGKIDKNKLIQELDEYGAWDESELSNHEDNLARILWLASWDIMEEHQID